MSFKLQQRQMAAARCLSHTVVSRSAAVTPVLLVLVLLLALGTPQGPDLLVVCQVSGLHVHGDREAGGSRPAVMQ